MHSRLFAVVAVGVSLIFNAFAQEDFKFEVALETANNSANKKRANLFEKYANAVERVQAELQKTGDLANALKARDEIRKAREQRLLGSSDFPKVEKLRSIMGKELDKIRLTETQATAKARATYVGQLSAKAIALTKAGRLDDAIAANRIAEAEKLRLQSDNQKIAELKVKGKPAAVLPAAPPTPLTPKPVPDNPTEVRVLLSSKKKITGELNLDPGLHRIKGIAIIGLRGDNKETKKYEDIKGHVTSQAGTVISGGRVYIHNGTFKANETRFDKVKLSEELQGRWTLKSCLLNDCEFKKDGGWEAGPYSARWDFENCVFEGRFFENWGSIGFDVENCTFHNIKFHRFSYHKDAGKEAISDGRRIKGCLFEDCTIPASTALATEDCLFRNCKFTKDMGDDPVIETPIEAILYFDDDYYPDELKLPDFVRLTFKPMGQAKDKHFGSTVRYTISRGNLDFE